MAMRKTKRPLVAAGTLLGIGLGGFVDGILFHQLFQAHSMLSAKVTRETVVGLEINMFWDGVFHAVTWIMTALGVTLLWNAVRRPDVILSTRALLGSLALGWGLFNLVEGVIDHHVLHLHHVVETDGHLFYDLAFLASGVALIVFGVALIRGSQGEPRATISPSA